MKSVLALNDEATYDQLFQDTIIRDANINGDLSKAETYTDCHMSAIGAFSDSLQGEVFKVARDTNSYADARSLFSKLIVLEMAADGERKQGTNAR